MVHMIVLVYKKERVGNKVPTQIKIQLVTYQDEEDTLKEQEIPMKNIEDMIQVYVFGVIVTHILTSFDALNVVVFDYYTVYVMRSIQSIS